VPPQLPPNLCFSHSVNYSIITAPALAKFNINDDSAHEFVIISRWLSFECVLGITGLGTASYSDNMTMISTLFGLASSGYKANQDQYPDSRGKWVHL